ncbi:MAG: hypothetical protein ACREIL_05795 [Nitrospiraceae bacterium]
MVRSTRTRILRFLPLGFILLLMVGCALGPGHGAASNKDSVPGKSRGSHPQESRQMQRPVGQERNPTVEDGTRAKKQQPSGQKPKDDLSLPPAPTKPPAIGGSGG